MHIGTCSQRIGVRFKPKYRGLSERERKQQLVREDYARFKVNFFDGEILIIIKQNEWGLLPLLQRPGGVISFSYRTSSNGVVYLQEGKKRICVHTRCLADISMKRKALAYVSMRGNRQSWLLSIVWQHTYYYGKIFP